MASNKPLPERAEAVYRELRSLRRHFRLSAWITLIVGGLLLFLVAFYFTWGYFQIAQLRDPEMIVSLVGQTVDTQIPLVRQNIEAQVQQNAGTWAEQASQQLLGAIPNMRQSLEAYALQQSDEVIAKIDTVGEDKFREILNQNRDALQSSINDLKNGKQVSDDVMLTLQHEIEKALQVDSKNQAEALRTMVTDMNASMKKLRQGEKLNREQQAERRALMLARRLQVIHIGDVTAEEMAGAFPVIGQMAEEMESRQLKKDTKETSAVPVGEGKKEEAAGKPDEKKPTAEETKAVVKPEEAKPAAKPEEKKEAAAEEKKPADKPEEAAKPADKPEEKKEAAAAEEKKPADKPEEAAKPADKPEEKKEAAAAEEKKPADKPEEAAKPADKPEEKKTEG